MDINTIPTEFVEKILLWVNNPIVSSFVCHQWRNIIKSTYKIVNVNSDNKRRKLKDREIDIKKFLPKMASNNSVIRADQASTMYYHASACNRLEVIIWLRENGYVWDEWTCANAALYNHLDLLKWLRKNGCPRDEFTCAYAAQNGHLDTLKWARENGCKWSHFTCTFAADKGHLNTLQWAMGNGCCKDEIMQKYFA